MSLFKQLCVAICILMLVSFAASVVVNVESSRDQQVNQLRAHAQDAATALGLSLSSHLDDPAMLELMVSSIFDSGYFESIRVIGVDEKVLVERSGASLGAGAPSWFANLVGLAAAQGDAIVSDGWNQAARVEVVSHPYFAIARLWQTAYATFLWLALISLVCIGLSVLLLKRQLRPLEYMVEQSNAIARREFLSAPNLPRTPEFRRVVNAMNQMVEKLKALFEEEASRSETLHAEAYQDSLTGLANRRYFDLELQARLTGEERASSGVLFLLRLNDLIGLNQRIGGQRTDQLLKAVAEQLQQVSQGRYLLARNRGGEFALLAAGLDRRQAEQMAEQLSNGLLSLQQTGASDCFPVAHIGITTFAAGASSSELYSALDRALAEAISHNREHWAFVEHRQQAAVSDEHKDWHDLLNDAFEQGRFLPYAQPVVNAAEPTQVLHNKVLARLQDEQGEPIAAGRFLPWLERFGWTARLDLLMLDAVLERLHDHEGRLALSLSGITVRDPHALQQVYERLRLHPAASGRLILELDEGQLPGPVELESITRKLRGFGVELGLQHFGGRFSMIGNLAKLGLAYLKVDGSFIRGIDQESDKRLFIEAMQRAANSIDLPLIAERVETRGELEVLRAMGIVGVQGRLFGEPSVWS
ncbi:diguanylate cyclase (GGDEF) domain-containing protein [Pseudomonas flavescens]|uniref:Diguanylate cyclase (GGDEF) domain-containing protein n=1 Tax=Phytopseudomonas flavescens TaxID=29435 RepID=A0A1G8QER2_9GAMM|nr:EAL domain-containing protein [Pseudomonas flavescens]SDJ03299.1 diguanylate cyclase (GGDEF) domain-containing protein [Pseudomonas flavescens]